MAAPGGARRWQLVLLLLVLAGLTHGASSIFEVKNNETACIMADFSAAFLVNYESKSGLKNVTIDLPSDAKVVDNSSSCGKENTSVPSLVIAFGRGYTLTLNFTRNATRYNVQMLSFTYNLSDSSHFLNASSKGTKTEVSLLTDIKADIDKKYRCMSHSQIHMDKVTVTFHDTTIQAYLSHGNFSKEETRCKQDETTPTTAPSPKPTTTPSPSPVPQNPLVHKYNVSSGNETCLLASMALQLNITYERKTNGTVTKVFNINPNVTKAVGSCSPSLVTLELYSENNTTVLLFRFGLNTTSNQFFLQGIQLTTTLSDAKDPAFKAANESLRALQATVGNSYKCNAEESIQVTQAFSVNIFSVWVQAFKVEGNEFGSVEECQLDENNMLIPIAVGGALAGLVLIVLIAYLIGRKRSHAGYQTI
ncbi:PREDICTED: lysosome-associated membrane glycoprotein 1 [Elephantulus edwardii]|uniref:lysosome-associated membrane glycoprotein 1 n=1 Tax=Elephantulus edwardii TaxID=28737 RepID=UPI0003F0D02E|nr:PREDICTED: lysosome-associated membrane glycoprotein 1 [Elephantulus edwardii]